ncbi:MAG: helix-turn-helix domain-containing protein [Victivallales bacterium]
MAKNGKQKSGLINIEVFIGGAPLLETRLCEGLLEFGQSHPQWRFSMRSSSFKYTGKWLKEHRIAGVIALIDSKPVARILDASGIPWVHLLPGKTVFQPCVNVDDRAIGRMGAEFFIDKGFLRCAFCGVGTVWSTERGAGFRERLAESGRDCASADIPFGAGHDWGLADDSEKLLRRWVAGLERGSSVMAAHDALANRIVDICLRQGLRIPQDIVVLGVGNHDLLCKMSPVPISSIDAAVPKVAVCGAAMLENLINGIQPSSPVSIAPKGVVERTSTEILSYGDDLVAKVVSYIRDHVCDGTRVENLPKIFSVSRRTLFRRFIKYVGHSPAAEIRQSRLKHARRMLTGTRMSLTEISYACGYTDLSHMDRAFRSAFGASPSSFRNKL